VAAPFVKRGLPACRDFGVRGHANHCQAIGCKVEKRGLGSEVNFGVIDQ